MTRFNVGIDGQCCELCLVLRQGTKQSKKVGTSYEGSLTINVGDFFWCLNRAPKEATMLEEAMKGNCKFCCTTTTSMDCVAKCKVIMLSCYTIV